MSIRCFGGRLQHGWMLPLFLLFGCLLAWPGTAAADVRARDVRVERYDAATRVSVAVSDALTYSVFVLYDPYRVVIDIAGGSTRMPPQQVGQGMVTRIRHGMYRADTLRIVLECSEPPEVRSTFLAQFPDGGGQHIILDLVPTTRDAVIAASRTPTSLPDSVSFAPSVPATVVPAAPAPNPTSFTPPLPTTVVPAAVPRPPRPAPERKGPKVIVIDPGHGGKDPGATSTSGYLEKNITLQAARELRDALRRRGGFRVVLTRDRDVFIPLRSRIDIARKADADLFISMHADSMERASMRGATVYTLSERASDREAQALADRENKSDRIAGVNLREASPDVTSVMIDLAQRQTMNDSARFAALLVGSLGDVSELIPSPHRFAGFAVLKAPDVPSVLIEMGYLSNEADEAQLRDRGHRRRLAESIAGAVDSYFAETVQARAP